MNVAKYSILGVFWELIKSGHRKYKWHKLHPHSDTVPMNSFNFDNVSIGNYSYGELNVIDFGGTNRLIIGNFVSIAQHVSFILNAEHHTNYLSTYPFKVKMLKIQNNESFGKGNIIIDDDVWIGYGATILSGIHIGQGAIIAAGAVVTKDVPAYSIVGGNPAKIIKMRFDDELIKNLKNLNYNLVDSEFVSKNINDLYTPLSSDQQLKKIIKENHALFSR